MRHLIMGTAGHVDHGKTALIKALTNIECDTHKEEKKEVSQLISVFPILICLRANQLGLLMFPDIKILSKLWLPVLSELILFFL